MSKRQFLSVLCIALCLTFLFNQHSNTAYADTSSTCGSTNPTHCFNGIAHDFGSAGLTAVSVKIFTPDYPSVTSTNGSSAGTSAWDMITTPGSGKYVQVGWCDNINMTSSNGSSTFPTPNGVHYFYEINYGVSGGDYQVYNTYGPAENSTHTYEVKLTANNYWQGTEDGAQIGAFASQIATDKYYFSGAEAQYLEEIGGSQIFNASFPGTSNNHARFSNVTATFNGTTYYSPSATIDFIDTDAGQSLHYGSTSVYPNQSNSYFDVWDSRY